jgi:molybdate transport system permease protein
MERDLMSEILEIVSKLDWSPLWISLKTGVVATFICFFLGIFAARKVLKLGPKTRAVVDGILTLPMVLAPTVTGFFLLLLFSMRRPVGAFLYGNLGIKVVQTWLGCILAASIIAFPLMYRNARAAFEQVDADLVYAARTLGMPEREIFWRVVMPAARPGIVSGAILTFARAIGEYGATSMLAGNIAGKTGTISQKIAMVIQNGDYATAGVWVVIMLVIAFVIVLAMNLVGSRGRNTEKRW